MQLDSVGGLPAHPLFVHIPVVLIPLVAIGAVAMAASASARDRIGWIVVGLAFVGGLSTQLAISSGQALQDAVDQSAVLDRHVELAESIRPLALVLFIVVLGVMLIDRHVRGRWPFNEAVGQPLGNLASKAVVALVVVVAIVTCGRLYQIGETGARAAWQNTHIGTEAGR